MQSLFERYYLEIQFTPGRSNVVDYLSRAPTLNHSWEIEVTIPWKTILNNPQNYSIESEFHEIDSYIGSP